MPITVAQDIRRQLHIISVYTYVINVTVRRKVCNYAVSCCHSNRHATKMLCGSGGMNPHTFLIQTMGGEE
jgi:hypothetical protein